ncbi:hypothetical protein AUP68_10983 [Ilyonectria robusta]
MELEPNHDPAFLTQDPDSDEETPSPDNDFYSNPANFFASSGRAVPKLPSAAEILDEVKKTGPEIFRNYKFLNTILERHESTIRKRWAKKTIKQRIGILSSAWLDMPASHRPDFAAFRQKGRQWQSQSNNNTGCYMWPYINQEDLSRTQPLLLLLNARGREVPSSFAAADLEAMRLGIVSDVIERPFLNNYTMILHGVTDSSEYGNLLAWDDHPDAFYWMHSQKQFAPADGIVVLQAQDRLMKFLVDCCQAILHDIQSDQLGSAAYSIQPEPPLKTEVESLGFESLAAMAATAPYRVPARFELEQVESLLAAKARAAEDHLWALREDPHYFHQHLVEGREHRQEMLKDTNGRPHPTLIPGQEALFWTRVVGNVLVEGYFELETFSELHQQSKMLVHLQRKHAAAISPMKDLPQEYLVALLRFRHFLNQAIKGPLAQLKQIVVVSPPMRKFYARLPQMDRTSSKIQIVSKGVKMTRIEEDLKHLLRTLWEDDHALFLFRLSNVVDELERLLEAEPAAKALISFHVAKTIGNLSILSQCLHQLEIYQPWAQNFDSAAVDLQSDLKKDYAEKCKPWALILAAFQDTNLGKTAKLGEPLPGRFTYPIDKRRTRENAETLRRAERNLDVFWAGVDRLLHAKLGKSQASAVQRLFSQTRILQRTPEWVEPSAGQKAVATVIAEQPLSPFYFGLSDNPSPKAATDRPESEPSKVKIKTRGAPGQSAEASENVEATHREDTATRPFFVVDNRALKVFRTLFFNPAVTSTPGELPWNHFVHAMASVGFGAQKLYGSVWHFSPVKSDYQGSIHFHEPHPSGKLSFVVARRYGRRLTRAYGWTGEEFGLRK